MNNSEALHAEVASALKESSPASASEIDAVAASLAKAPAPSKTDKQSVASSLSAK
jgi:hypothetical protein